MTPRQVLEKWIDSFNHVDTEVISSLYADNGTNHQVTNEPIIGKRSKDKCSQRHLQMLKWFVFRILEWKDPKGLRVCGFFNIKDDKIIFQQGYWDRLSFQKLHNIPL